VQSKGYTDKDAMMIDQTVKMQQRNVDHCILVAQSLHTNDSAIANTRESETQVNVVCVEDVYDAMQRNDNTYTYTQDATQASVSEMFTKCHSPLTLGLKNFLTQQFKNHTLPSQKISHLSNSKNHTRER